MRLLVVEDDSKIASFIIKGLKAAGYAVDHASDGEKALGMVLTEPYDTAIIDIMLPKRDGLSLIEKCEKRRCAPRLSSLAPGDRSMTGSKASRLAAMIT